MYNNSNSYGNNRIETNTVVFYLIVINVIVYLISHYASALIPGGAETLVMHYPSSDYFNPIQIVTHMFMHANFQHILFNMYGVYIFGNILERVWGPRRFLEFYFMTGLGAIALYVGVQALQVYNITGYFAPPTILVPHTSQAYDIINGQVLGASGAVFGILTAFAMLFPNTELYLMFIPIPIKAKYLVGGYALFELYSGISNNPGDNVAHFAHLGGALVGFIVIKIWNRNRNSLY